MIPKVIHQTFPSLSRLTPDLIENVEALKAMNPGWQHVMHTDECIVRYIQKHFDAEVLAAYQSINLLYGAARADFFRYLLIYNEGGVYLDIKSGALTPLDSFIQPSDELLLSHWNNQPGQTFEGWGRHTDDGVASELQNWHLIARPKHPLIEAAVQSVLKNIRTYSMRRHGVGKFGVLRTTGPLAYSKALLPLLNQHPHRLFDSESAGLVYSVIAHQPGKQSHKSLFRQHYTRLKLPLVSSGPQRPWHYARYKLMRLTGLMR